MARAQAYAKLNRPQKFQTRHRNRCKVCGRPRGYYRDFEMCRICLRNLALRGELPGVIKASW
jgi:small subunit ribosomal protein S14